MTYTPNPLPYGPPGYPGAPLSSVGMTVRWAGIVLLIAHGLALLMGGCFVALASQLPQLLQDPQIRNNPGMQQMLSEVRKADIDLQAMLYVFSGLMIAYAVAGIVVGVLLVRARSKGLVVLGLVFVSITLVLLLLMAIPFLLSGQLCNIVGIALGLAVHGVALFWLIQGLRAGQETMIYPYGPYTPPPMQGYHYPPRQ